MSIEAGPTRAELEQRLDELSRTVQELRHELSGTEHAPDEPRSRRHLLKAIGGAAAAGAVAGTIGSRTPALAADGEAVFCGRLNGATRITYLAYGAVSNVSPGTLLATEPTMFWVDNRNTPRESGNGVRADGKGVNGVGVWGNNDFNGVGVLASGGIGIRTSGNVAAVLLAGTNPPPLTRSTAHARGEIDIDLNGDVWLCTEAGTPGSWRKLAGPASAGAFHPINPARVHDSRVVGGPISSGQHRLISVANGFDTTTGLLNAPNVVPVGATAIAFNLTITGTVQRGFLTAAPGTATSITASSINWSGDNLEIANGLIVQLDSSRQVRIFAGGGGNTNFILDVSGYFI